MKIFILHEDPFNVKIFFLLDYFSVPMNFRKAITYYFEDCYGDEKLTRTPKIQSQIEAYWMYVVVCLLYLFTLFMVLSHSNFVLNKALEGSYIPVILFFLFWSYSLFTFISLRNSDPGIIPGLKYQEPEPIEKEEREEKSETLKERKKKKEEVLKQDIPERAKYCRKCEGYIAKYDHHCFWIGICVGEKNHYKFIRFLITQIVFIVVALIIAAHGFYLKIYQFQKLNQFQMPILLLISTLVILVGFFIGFFLVWLPVIMVNF